MTEYINTTYYHLQSLVHFYVNTQIKILTHGAVTRRIQEAYEDTLLTKEQYENLICSLNN